jgi:hypothetical protein
LILKKTSLDTRALNAQGAAVPLRLSNKSKWGLSNSRMRKKEVFEFEENESK